MVAVYDGFEASTSCNSRRKSLLEDVPRQKYPKAQCKGMCKRKGTNLAYVEFINLLKRPKILAMMIGH